jgi:tellurium resistance protein TerD
MLDLTKGNRIDLTKGTALTKVKIGLGWDVKAVTNTGLDFDLDAIAAAVTADGKVTDNPGFVYFKNTSGLNGAITHSGDNITGAGVGEDEIITIDLAAIPADKEAVEITICIFDAVTRNQNFGQVNNAFARVYNAETNEELGKIDLTEDYSSFKSVRVCRIYRHGGEWKLQVEASGLKTATDGPFIINDLAASYGLI